MSITVNKGKINITSDTIRSNVLQLVAAQINEELRRSRKILCAACSCLVLIVCAVTVAIYTNNILNFKWLTILIVSVSCTFGILDYFMDYSISDYKKMKNFLALYEECSTSTKCLACLEEISERRYNLIVAAERKLGILDSAVDMEYDTDSGLLTVRYLKDDKELRVKKFKAKLKQYLDVTEPVLVVRTNKNGTKIKLDVCMPIDMQNDSQR